MNKITHYDILSINDFLSKNPPKKHSRMIGLARFKKNGIIDTTNHKDGWINNMTIATGREFAAQASFKKFSGTSALGNLTTYKVDGFGIGSGGATEVGGTVTLLGPDLGDKGLYTPIAINAACLDAYDNAGVLQTDVVKLIESTGAGGQTGSITFEMSNNVEFTSLPDDYYTVVKCSCIIDNTEPSYLAGGESVNVSEAMLFLTSATNTDPRPFAHICFAPKWIEKESTIEIEWYVLF